MNKRRRTAAHHQCKSQGVGKSSLGVIFFGSWIDETAQVFNGPRHILANDAFASYRPFYTVVTGPNAATMSTDSQTVMDQSIAYAKAGGIDYFAFDQYFDVATTVGIADAELFNKDLKWYLSSTHKADVKFCILLVTDPGDASKLYSILTPRFLAQMAEPSYMTVLGGRPLIYIDNLGAYYGPLGSVAATKAWVDDLRAQAIAAGHPNPYIVDAAWGPGSTVAADTGLDAISGYGSNRVGGHEASYRVIPYHDLTVAAVDLWEAQRATGLKVIPNFACGQDNQPYWNTVADMLGLSRGTLVANATDEEWADVARLAINWNQAHPTIGEANSVLMYAWSEFGEGGQQICPTLNGPGRLNALRSMLNYL